MSNGSNKSGTPSHKPTPKGAGGSVPLVSASQAHRQARFHCSLEKDTLLLNELFAREKVSGLFEYQIVVSSEKDDIDLDALVGEPAHVELMLQKGGTKDSGKREFCGIVTEITFSAYRDNLAEYRLVLRPWLWLLTQASNNRIFQNRSVPQIITMVCKDHGFSDIDNRLGGTYGEREYCVQYRESDFDFLSRLMEDEGIHYYFEHAKGKHVLILADDLTTHVASEGYAKVPYFPLDKNNKRDGEHLNGWQVSRAVRPGAVTLKDFEFKTPRADLLAKSAGAKARFNEKLERYEYPSCSLESEVKNSAGRGQSLAKIRLQEAQSDQELMRASGNVRGLVPGCLFKLEKYPRKDQNRRYLTLALTHRLTLGGYDSGGVDANNAFEYDCAVTAVPDTVAYRPPRLTPKPFVQGPQTAIVVGESGKEIDTDPYGRIKVKFHWDRRDESDENSSCWVRVSQIWAGSGWGAQFIPRVGQEVIVEFLEGNPDRPIVTGSVYNGGNHPPYRKKVEQAPAQSAQPRHRRRPQLAGELEQWGPWGLRRLAWAEEPPTDELLMLDDQPTQSAAEPAKYALEATQSGIRTRSTPNGDDKTYNEIRFEDKKGAEELYVQAEKDMKILVKNNRTEDVGGDETVTVSKNRNHTITIDDTRIVKGKDKEEIAGRQDVTVDGARGFEVKGAETRDVRQSQTETIGSDWKKTVTGDIDIVSAGDITITAAGNAVIKDVNHVDISDCWWEITGSSGSITGADVSLTATSNALTGSDVSVTAFGLGITAVAVNLTGLETNLLIHRVDKVATEIRAKAATVESAAVELKKFVAQVNSGATSIDSSGLKVFF